MRESARQDCHVTAAKIYSVTIIETPDSYTARRLYGTEITGDS
jgi:hypothetical protein